LSGVYTYLGQNKQAIICLEAALKYKPNDHMLLNELAWALATAPDKKVRNPEKAVRFAYHACKQTEFNNPSYLDTLAAAYASTGSFNMAVETAAKALKLAQLSKQTRMANEIKKRLDVYKTGHPFHETHLGDK
jgi:tetratricopeptide (TPR) repeat protein